MSNPKLIRGGQGRSDESIVVVATFFWVYAAICVLTLLAALIFGR
jgi:hypothetical protein